MSFAAQLFGRLQRSWVQQSHRVPPSRFARCFSNSSTMGPNDPYGAPGIRPRLTQAANPLKEDFSKMTNEELMNTNSIPGWDLIHSPPGTLPRGALVGTVISTKMQKTINVAVKRFRVVPKIRKRVTYTRKFMAHDENESANLGDLVLITPCHKISKMKHFLLRKIVRPKGQL